MTDDTEFIKKLPLDEQKAYLKAYLKAEMPSLYKMLDFSDVP